MTDLNRISNLAIVGMDVATPNGEGLNAFGRLVYRGIFPAGQFDGVVSLEAIIRETAAHALNEAGFSPVDIPVICLSTQTASGMKIDATNRQIVDFSNELSPLTTALNTAANWIETSEAEAVLLVESRSDMQSVCAVILTAQEYAIDNAKPIYAILAAVSECSEPLTAQSVALACKNAIQSAGIDPRQVSLIETSSLYDPTENLEESLGIISAYSSSSGPTCALNNGGGGLISLVKAAWSLSQRVIPGITDWSGTTRPEIWRDTSFYVPANSRTWFSSGTQERRWAGVNLNVPGEGFTHILIGEGYSKKLYCCEALKEETFYLLPVAAESAAELYTQLSSLHTQISASTNLKNEAIQAYRRWLDDKSSTSLTTCLLGHTPEELAREIGFALKGIPTALERNNDWQTPLGSYFTPKPLGETGSTAFVYPGAFNSYPGMGQDLFYLFPLLFDRFGSMTRQIDQLLNEKALYPRSLAALTQADLDQIEAQLTADPLVMLISGTSISVLYTTLLEEVFDVHPASAFGYSLGEISMMFASGVWTRGDEISAALRNSPLFHTRLAGPQNAIREYWQLPAQNDTQGVLWENYVLMATPEQVLEILQNEPRVYLTHINTPRQVVIGGDPNGCRRVISLLKCNALQAPFNYALHCAAMQSEYEALTNLHSWPISNQPEMTLYSAANYHSFPIDQQSIARQIAHGLCSRLDFPRLIQQAYAEGSRIFIELGAGSNCARWVDESLKGQPHAAFSINRKGVDDHTSILRLIARLVCHHVQTNLNPLYA
jgi:PfaB family protein